MDNSTKRNFWPEKSNHSDLVIALLHWFNSFAIVSLMALLVVFFLLKNLNSSLLVWGVLIDSVLIFLASMMSAKFINKIINIKNSNRIALLSLIFMFIAESIFLVLKLMSNEYSFNHMLSSSARSLLILVIFYITSKKYLINNTDITKLDSKEDSLVNKRSKWIGVFRFLGWILIFFGIFGLLNVWYKFSHGQFVDGQLFKNISYLILGIIFLSGNKKQAN